MATRGRPEGTGKPDGEKYIFKGFKFPPALWARFEQVVPAGERSKTIAGYMEKEIRKRGRAALG